MLTGLSLTLCIPEIASGKVPYSQVTKIITTTTIQQSEMWEGFIAHTKRVLWTMVEGTTPEECESIFRNLLSEGKIEQPLLTGGQHPGTATFHWLDEQGNGVTV